MRALNPCLAALALLAAGCDETPAAGAPASSTATSAAPVLAAGTRILVGNGRVGFVEGEVIAAGDDQVRYSLGAPDSTNSGRAKASAPRAQVWPVGHGVRPASGQHLVCELSTSKWVPCKVISATGSIYLAEDRFGERHEMTSQQLVATDDETAANIGSYLTREARHRKFDEAFKAAGAPERASSWKPTKDEPVVIHFAGTSWYGGTVLAFDPAKQSVRVSYHGKTFDDRDVPLERVIPEPSKPAMLQRDQFVIVRPEESDALWAHARVVGIDGDNIEVVDRDDLKRRVASNAVAAVSPSRASRPEQR